MKLEASLCRDQLAAADRAFLATTGEDLQPHLVPITFALTGPDTLLFAVDAKPKTTTDLRRLRNLRWNPRVAVLADRYDADWTRLWWVRADGIARVLPATPIEALTAKYPQYRDQPPAGPFVAIDVARWTGWSAR